MKTKISLTNTKLSGMIPSVNLPAVKTCRSDAPCKHLCYANGRGNFRFENVKKSHMENLAHFIANPKAYFDDIIEFLNGLVSYRFFRFHSSGDIVNKEYLEGMVRVAKKCKNTKFLAFTKKFELVNEYLKDNKLPKNLKIVFSAWDKNFKVDNPHNLPVTYVMFKDKTQNAAIPELAIECPGKCYECMSCWSLVNGQSVVFHQH